MLIAKIRPRYSSCWRPLRRSVLHVAQAVDPAVLRSQTAVRFAGLRRRRPRAGPGDRGPRSETVAGSRAARAAAGRLRDAGALEVRPRRSGGRARRLHRAAEDQRRPRLDGAGVAARRGAVRGSRQEHGHQRQPHGRRRRPRRSRSTASPCRPAARCRSRSASTRSPPIGPATARCSRPSRPKRARPPP